MSAKGDASFFAQAVDWLLEENAKLPAGQKIRVLSVSAAPNTSSWENGELWDGARQKASDQGILVLDCTELSFVGSCGYDLAAPDVPWRCQPGFGDEEVDPAYYGRLGLMVPCWPRTVAQEYRRGEFDYQYCGVGGSSWSVPYCAGVAALGWQLKPELTAQDVRLLLNDTAQPLGSGRVIDPPAFVGAVRGL